MHERMERFRRRVARHFGGRPGRGARYSEELRAEAVALTQEALESGENLRSIGAALGMRSATLAR
jgi:transposase-like protein